MPNRSADGFISFDGHRKSRSQSLPSRPASKNDVQAVSGKSALAANNVDDAIRNRLKNVHCNSKSHLELSLSARRGLRRIDIPRIPFSAPNTSRSVPAFSTSSRMKNTVVKGPPKVGVFRPRPSPPTTFKKMYDRGDIPVTLHHDYRGHSLRWKVDIEKVDYHHYLPLFFDGLRETKHPYDFFSRAGVRDLLAKGGDRILPVIPQLILPLKYALNTRQPKIICTVLQVIQELVMSAPPVGEALVPYYRQLLPTLNLFKHWNCNLGDEIDYSQQRHENIGDLIQDTLEILERRGGRDAYINIKYMIPTYQSCLLN